MSNFLLMRFWSKSLFSLVIKSSGLYYLSPSNLNYFWNFGFFSFFFLMLQIVTGIILAMFYNPSASLAYSVIMDINNEVYYGWWVRALHANGASFFFIVVYIHMARSIYYGSFIYPRQLLWITGVILWVLMIITAFFGYILPWGQMSFWGAMVITNLFYAIPLIGTDLIYLLWGGFSIDDATLHRFYSLHFTLPFIILFLSLLHFFCLHEFGSNNPLGISSKVDSIPFFPYYIIKDTFSLIIVLFLLFLIIFKSPDFLGHTDNYNRANFLVTPAHIVPEWYFLPLYAVLRSVTSKLFGIFLIALLIICLLLLPFLLKNNVIRSSIFKPFFAFFFWSFLFDCVILGWIGGLPVMSPYLIIGQLSAVWYFFSVFLLLPLMGFLELLLYNCFHVKKIWYGSDYHDYEYDYYLEYFKNLS